MTKAIKEYIINNDKNLTATKTNTENKFFNILEDEPVRMGPTAPVREVEIPSFDLIRPEEEIIEISKNTKSKLIVNLFFRFFS